MPDYTKQLDAIIALLSQRTFPSWGVAILSAFLGLIAGAALEPVRLLIADYRKQVRLRKLLYREITYLYFNASMIAALNKSAVEMREDLIRTLTFTNYEYARQAPDDFMMLSEQLVIENIYRAFQRLTEDRNNFFLALGFTFDIKRATRNVEQAIANNQLDIHVITEVCPKMFTELFRELAYGHRKPS